MSYDVSILGQAFFTSKDVSFDMTISFSLSTQVLLLHLLWLNVRLIEMIKLTSYLMLLL